MIGPFSPALIFPIRQKSWFSPSRPVISFHFRLSLSVQFESKTLELQNQLTSTDYLGNSVIKRVEGFSDAVLCGSRTCELAREHNKVNSCPSIGFGKGFVVGVMASQIDSRTSSSLVGVSLKSVLLAIENIVEAERDHLLVKLDCRKYQKQGVKKQIL